jgi:hypothetical protein
VSKYNTNKYKNMLTYHHQMGALNHGIKAAIRSFEIATKLRYLGTIVRNENLIHDEIKSRLNSGNACFHLVQDLLSSRLLCKNVKMKLYRIIYFPVCET